MLSRSSLSIRNFIPHRRPSVSDEDMSGAECKNEDRKDQDGGNIGTPANAKRRSNRRPRAPASVPLIATTSLTHYDVLRPLPPLPSETPRSSASLSDRCERHVDCDCPLLNSRRRSPHYTTTSFRKDSTSSNGSSGSPDCAPILDASSCGADDSLTSRVPKSRFYQSRLFNSKEEVVPNRRPLSPGTENKEKASEHKELGGSLVPELSDGLQQFIQETEDAFRAIGITITEVPPAQSVTEDTKQRRNSGSASEPDPTPPTPPPKELSFPNDSPASLSKSVPVRMPSVFDSSPESSPSIGFSPSQAPRRRKSKKSTRTRSMRPQRKPAAALKQAAKTGPRWTLTENVSELLTGRLFHRIQADEMLTPAEIEAYKQLREKKQQAEKAAEAAEAAEAVESDDVADTPVEPFHLDDLPSRIGSAGVVTDPEEPTEKPSIIFSEDVVQRDFSFERRHIQNKSSISSLPPERPSSTPRPLNKNNTFPMSSPSKPVSRHLRSASRGKVNELPIIPEACCDTTEFVYLRATPYSLTTPRFRHGPIRLSKADLVPEVKLGADDGLDWTAFQMAILGGAGDWFTDSDDTIRRREAEELADIVDWWGSWNFRSTGELITSPYEASSPTSTLSGDEIPDITPAQAKTADTPYRPLNHTWQSPSRASGADGLQLNLDFTKHPPSFYMDAQSMDAQWRRDSEQKQVVVNRDSVGTVGSLPPSPMLDLRVIRSEDGDDFDVVPMGYNLGHDLGDFLKWEAEHAYAGDFHSPTGTM